MIDKTTIIFSGCGNYLYTFKRKTCFLWDTTCIDVECRYHVSERIPCLSSRSRKCE